MAPTGQGSVLPPGHGRRSRHQSTTAVIICVSDATAERFAELCRPIARSVVAPHGVDRDRFGIAEPAPGADVDVLAQLGIDGNRPLVVFVGTLGPRKGVAGLVAAFDRVAEPTDAMLVLAGQPGWGRGFDALATAKHRDRVVVTGYVPDATVPTLLRRATTVAYPSLDEGFGLPAFEALACSRTPLVTTTGTPMAGVAGDAALLVTPGDVDTLAEALDTLLDGDPGVEAPAPGRTAAGLRPDLGAQRGATRPGIPDGRGRELTGNDVGGTPLRPPAEGRDDSASGPRPSPQS